jgi:putative hydrolase of the HAD superfamily
VIRAIFFDAGNTLVRMNYGDIAAELGRHGVRSTPEAIQRAEWRARVRLDEEVFAPAAAGVSTESRSSAGRYVQYVLDALGITDAGIVEALVEWRRTYNPPVGLWNTADPHADAALGLVRAAGLAAAVISNSNGTVRSILETLGLASRLDFVLDSFEVGVEKPDPRIFGLAIERAGVSPGEAVYVGDLYSVDVRGAHATGMDAILLDPGGHWGGRDCLRAADVLAAVRLILDARAR